LVLVGFAYLSSAEWIWRLHPLGSGLPCFWVSPFVGLTSRMPYAASVRSSYRAGTDRASQVPGFLSTRIPRSKVDPGRPLRTSPYALSDYGHRQLVRSCWLPAR